jgi:hypothetical protein
MPISVKSTMRVVRMLSKREAQEVAAVDSIVQWTYSICSLEAHSAAAEGKKKNFVNIAKKRKGKKS